MPIYDLLIKHCDRAYKENIDLSVVLEEASDLDKAKLALALLESMKDQSIWAIRQVKELIV